MNTARQLPKNLWYSKGQQFEEVGFAFNERILQGLLRDEMGFTGYVNSDTGIIGDRAWGVEELSDPEQYAKAIGAGTDLFSGGSDPSPLLDAVARGLVKERQLDKSVTLLVSEMFDLGLFEDPYVDPEVAQLVADDPDSQAKADEAHRKSVTLLRNDDAAGEAVLPITDDEVEDVRLYVEVFQERGSVEQTAALKETITSQDPSITIVDTPEEATHSYLWVIPSLAWSEDDTEADPPSIELKKDSDTGIDSERILAIQEKVETSILGVNMTNPWLIDEIEPGADAVLATFHTSPPAVVDVIRGRFNPGGRLPLTVPADQPAVRRNASDVPGYAEDFDYAYTNAAGDAYEFGFGLSYRGRPQS